MACLIIQATTPENVKAILIDIPPIDPLLLKQLGELVKCFDLDSEFRASERYWFPHSLSFIDENGQLTPNFRLGLETLKAIRASNPELLPAKSDGFPPPPPIPPERMQLIIESQERRRRIIESGNQAEIDRLL